MSASESCPISEDYAIVCSGGQQHRVKVGQLLRVEKIEAPVGEVVELNPVLLLVDNQNIKVGEPALNGLSVKAEITAHGRGDKVVVIKFRRRQNYRRKQGHRQFFTELKILSLG
jgi:large subunit ribosomal protein L21